MGGPFVASLSNHLSGDNRGFRRAVREPPLHRPYTAPTPPLHRPYIALLRRRKDGVQEQVVMPAHAGIQGEEASHYTDAGV